MSLETKVDKIQDDITDIKVELAKYIGKNESNSEKIEKHDKYISKAKERGAVFLGISMGGGFGLNKIIEWFQNHT